MAATPSGKDKVMRYARLHVGGYDLSGDARTVGSLENSYNEADMTGWGDDIKNFLTADSRMVGIRGLQAILNDAAGRAFAILKDSPNSHHVTIFMGGGGEPAVPDPTYHIPGLQFSDVASLDGGVFKMDTDVLFNTTSYAAGADNPFGVCLSFGAKTATNTGASHDNGAATTAGYSATLHITASSGGTWQFKLQHSTDDTAWADLATFTANGSAVTAEFKAANGTVNRYVRLLETRTSGTVTTSCSFARN